MKLEGKLIRLSQDPRDNILEYDGKYYQIDFLNGDGKYIQGGNGIVFKLSNEEGLDYVIKFIKYPNQDDHDWKVSNRITRFEREVEALFIAQTNNLSNIVPIEFSGWFDIQDQTFGYYVMQKCDTTLRNYLAKYGDELDLYQKTLLCQKILQGIQGLHEYKIYHRDIKHDNIYFIGNEPYIGDLGLADYQDTDYYLDEYGELIGPTGWFSPEAINKYLVEKTPKRRLFDCKIDSKSEVFQLGKLFWYIYQGNIPIGQIEFEDFLPSDETIFNIIYKMLHYSKVKRSDSNIVADEISSYLSK